MSDIKSILIELGYTNLTDFPREIRTRPIYRDSNNNTVLSIKKDTGRWIDFARGASGSFEELVMLTLKLANKCEAEKWLKNKKFEVKQEAAPKPLIHQPKKFDKSCLAKVIKDHSYWESRGIDKRIIEKFNGGVVLEGKMANRYIFPIQNSQGDLIGVVGRTILPPNDKTVKWKIIGESSNFCFPAQLNYQIIKNKKSVILVESIGDALALYNAGIENVLVIFGLNLGIGPLNLLLKMDVDCITISSNNEKSNIGNEAAEKIRNKLLRYFDSGQIEVVLPTKKDFGEMTVEEIQSWEKGTKCYGRS